VRIAVTFEEALQKFGLPASPGCRMEIRNCLSDELQRERNEAGDQELMRALCAQLFSLGVLEDSLLIWEAKACNFDTMCGIDVQFLCGAGLDLTKDYLATLKSPDAIEALNYLAQCEAGGDFAEFTREKWTAYTRSYYGLDSMPDESSDT
jgi:hypothetical protein